MDTELFPRARSEIAPGAVHVPDWLDARAQHELLEACRWGSPRSSEAETGGGPARPPDCAPSARPAAAP